MIHRTMDDKRIGNSIPEKTEAIQKNSVKDLLRRGKLQTTSKYVQLLEE